MNEILLVDDTTSFINSMNASDDKKERVANLLMGIHVEGKDHIEVMTLYDGYSSSCLSYIDTDASVGYIIITGGLVADTGTYAWNTSYGNIVEAYKMLVDDNRVATIIGRFSSSGGHAVGAFEASKTIYDMRNLKPSIAFVDTHCLSGAYAIASSFGKVYSNKLANTGSIGAVVELSEYASADVKTKTIVSGSLKSPSIDNEEYLAQLQNGVNETYNDFKTAIARNRGISVSEIDAMQGGVFIAQDAIRHNLIDGISTITNEVDKVTDQLKIDETNKIVQALAGELGYSISGEGELVKVQPKVEPRVEPRVEPKVEVTARDSVDTLKINTMFEASGVPEALRTALLNDQTLTVEGAQAMVDDMYANNININSEVQIKQARKAESDHKKAVDSWAHTIKGGK